MQRTGSDRFKIAIVVLAATGLIAGLVLWFSGNAAAASLAWAGGVLPALVALLIEILRSLGRGEVGLDIVAALSMTAALTVGETLAAAVVALMYSGGTFLESFAEGRARREMRDSRHMSPGRRHGTATAASKRFRSAISVLVTGC